MRYLLLPTYILITVLYFPIFSVYFSQDDFFHFKAAQTDGSISEFLQLFNFPNAEERGYSFYRPLSREGLYHLYYQLFGLSSTPFRVLSLTIHFINVFLVFIFTERILKDRRIAWFSSFFYGFSAYNVGVLYYGAGGIETSILTLLALLTLILYESNHRYLSVLTFILGLMSHEIFSVTPVLIAGLIIIRSREINLLLILSKLSVFLIIWGIYLYLDIIQIGVLPQEHYTNKPSLSLAINSLGWYTAWGLGVPEMLVDFVSPGFKLNPNLMRFWGDYYQIIFPAFFSSLIILATSVIYFVTRNRSFLINWVFIYFALWFPVSLLPVLFLPQHKFLHYLALAEVGFWTSIGYLVIKFGDNVPDKRIGRTLTAGVVLLLSILSMTSIKLGEKNYWAAERGRVSGKIIQEIKSKYPILPPNSAIYIQNDPQYPFLAQDWGGTSNQARFILNDQDALQLIYGDNSLKTFYEDLGGIPADFTNQVFPVVAKLY